MLTTSTLMAILMLTTATLRKNRGCDERHARQDKRYREESLERQPTLDGCWVDDAGGARRFRGRADRRSANHYRSAGLAEAGEVRGVDRHLLLHNGVGFLVPARVHEDAPDRRSSHSRGVHRRD